MVRSVLIESYDQSLWGTLSLHKIIIFLSIWFISYFHGPTRNWSLDLLTKEGTQIIITCVTIVGWCEYVFTSNWELACFEKSCQIQDQWQS